MPLDGVVVIVPVVKAIDVRVAVPPVIATDDAFCVDIVPRPVMSVFGIVEDAVKADVPLPLTYPVSVMAPVPPEATGNVPVVRADVDVAYTAPFAVKDVRFVPPLAVPSVPLSVRTPVVVIGPPVKVMPVVPPDASTLMTVPVPVTVDQVGGEPTPCVRKT